MLIASAKANDNFERASSTLTDIQSTAMKNPDQFGLTMLDLLALFQ